MRGIFKLAHSNHLVPPWQKMKKVPYNKQLRKLLAAPIHNITLGYHQNKKDMLTDKA
jgi:hypothetical protein